MVYNLPLPYYFVTLLRTNSYKKAHDVLPPRLVAAIQQYAQGCYVYIPKQAQRTGWGQKNGTRSALTERNLRIQADYLQGDSTEVLADRYFFIGGEHTAHCPDQLTYRYTNHKKRSRYIAVVIQRYNSCILYATASPS